MAERIVDKDPAVKLARKRLSVLELAQELGSVSKARMEMLMQIFLVDPLTALGIAKESMTTHRSSLQWAQAVVALEERFMRQFAQEEREARQARQKE